VPLEPHLPPLRPRSPGAHKASVGRVLIVGGSLGMAGAPSLAARGALRAGAGLVTIAVPERIADTVARFQAEAMVLPLPCDPQGRIVVDAVDVVRDRLDRADALVVGPGLGRAEQAQAAVRFLVQSTSQPLVLDADGLHAVRSTLAQVHDRGGPTVLTPHEGEAALLLGTTADSPRTARDERASRLAHLANGLCVLKGPGTVVSDGTRSYHNSTGGPLLATGGSGDVLSGMIAAFLAGLPATGGDVFGATCLAVHLHGAAGDRLASFRGDRGILAGEIADAVPDVIRSYVWGKERA
jgi:NAD(P)H-hydrate epimerase